MEENTFISQENTIPSKVQATTLVGSKQVASSKKISACSYFSIRTARTPHSNKLRRDHQHDSQHGPMSVMEPRQFHIEAYVLLLILHLPSTHTFGYDSG